MPGMTIEQLMAQRWSVQGPQRVVDEQQQEHWEIRIAELPDFFVAAEDAAAARNEYLPALEAFLQSFIDAGEGPPLPQHPYWATHADVFVARAGARPAGGVFLSEPDTVTC